MIITMAGLGSRFTNIGFKVPKHEIMAQGKSLFEWSMLSLADFYSEKFIFIARKEGYNREFIDSACARLGIADYSIIELDYLTDGQAATALLADSELDKNESVIIYNIDTYVREFAIKSDDIADQDGFIPVFRAEGEKWSFIKLNESDEVVDVVEKRRISDLATIGFYYFKSWQTYCDYYDKYSKAVIAEYGEVYIAPLYSHMLKDNLSIGYSIIDGTAVHVLGTPEDVSAFAPDYLQENSALLS